jgi:hypothetical protein
MTLALISPFHVGDLKMPLPASSYLLRKGFGDATARRTKNGTGTGIVLRLFAWSCGDQVRIWRGKYLAGGTPLHWCGSVQLGAASACGEGELNALSEDIRTIA